MGKRESCRAIVISKNGLVVMYREKNDRVYYTFPGGGLEDAETLEECVVRECLEEFGINVKPIREVYIYENDTTIQHFFVCTWISGELGSGEGEEFQPDRNKGIYVPSIMPLDKIAELPLMPPEVALQLSKDVKAVGAELKLPLKRINA